MTTTRPTSPPAAPTPPFRLPDIPQKHPDDMTSVKYLHEPGQTHHLSQYLGNHDTTLVTAERYVVPGPAYVANESRYPDLLVAFNVDPAAYEARNGYVVSEQGKAPDFILEVASRRTASDDRGEEGLLRGTGSRRVLAIRQRGGVLRVHTGRLPTGRRPLPAHRGA